jgi:hypothetical protein
VSIKSPVVRAQDISIRLTVVEFNMGPFSGNTVLLLKIEGVSKARRKYFNIVTLAGKDYMLIE